MEPEQQYHLFQISVDGMSIFGHCHSAGSGFSTERPALLTDLSCSLSLLPSGMAFHLLSWFYLFLPIILPFDSTLFFLYRNASLNNLKKHMVSHTCFVFRRSFRLGVLTQRFSDFSQSLTVNILIRVLL